MEKIVNKLYKLKETSPDLMIKKIKVNLFSYLYVASFETITSSDKINDFILKYISSKRIINTKKDIKNFIPSINYVDINKDETINYLLNGFTIIIYKNEVIAFETRADLDRGIASPQSEPSLRGPKEAFIENYQKNIGLIRKRIKSEKLIIDELNIGNKSKTKIGIIYLKNNNLASKVKEKINNINIDSIVDINYIKDFIDKDNHTLFPTVLYTEKADDAARFLLNNRVILISENSPSIAVLPTYFMDYFISSEDFYHKKFFSSFMRFIRFMAFILSITLPSFFISIINYDPEMIPFPLLINFSSQRINSPFPLIIEAFLLMITFELLYEGDSKTPEGRGTSLSVLGALVLGESSVKAGLISPIMVIVVSISSIASLIFTYHDIQGVIRFYRYFLMIISSLFGIIGLIIGIELLLLDISSITLFNKPYISSNLSLIKKEDK